MTGTGPIHRVVSVLERAGYEIVKQPGPIGGIPFEFSAMLAGAGSLDLVAVVDLAVDRDDQRIRRRVEGLALALDLVSSRRSLTVVLVGPGRGPELIRAIAGVARVLPVGLADEDHGIDLRHALAVLLPLHVAVNTDEVTDSWPAARDRMFATYPHEVASALAAAGKGQAAALHALRAILLEPIGDLDGQEDA